MSLLSDRPTPHAGILWTNLQPEKDAHFLKQWSRIEDDWINRIPCRNCGWSSTPPTATATCDRRAPAPAIHLARTPRRRLTRNSGRRRTRSPDCPSTARATTATKPMLANPRDVSLTTSSKPSSTAAASKSCHESPTTTYS